MSMSYFPMLYNISNKKILLVGAGSIATFKFNKILEFSPQKLIVVADKFSDEVLRSDNKSVELIKRKFLDSDLIGVDIVVVAVNDLELQSKIYFQCQNLKIPCNCVDELKHCDFIFPSTIKQGDIIISVSTSGKVPGFSVALREYLETLLPANLDKKFQELIHLRASLPSGSERMKRIRFEATDFFKKILNKGLM